MISMKALLKEDLDSLYRCIAQQQNMHIAPFSSLVRVALTRIDRDQAVDLGEFRELLGDQGEDHKDDTDR